MNAPDVCTLGIDVLTDLHMPLARSSYLCPLRGGQHLIHICCTQLVAGGDENGESTASVRVRDGRSGVRTTCSGQHSHVQRQNQAPERGKTI